MHVCLPAAAVSTIIPWSLFFMWLEKRFHVVYASAVSGALALL